MLLHFTSLYLLISTAFAYVTKRNSNWDYQNDKIKGISLGGWFLIEPFITPSLFEQFGTDESEIPVDEYTFTEKLGKEESTIQLEKHWSTWITEDDIKDIKNYGFNLVRIPIGYWAFFTLDDDPYIQGQEKYFDQAIEWAKKYDLKVWFDLHGIPGSQNGFDNSGKRGDVEWLSEDENIDLSYKTLEYIYEKYAGEDYEDTIIGIEIVNEPLGPKLEEEDLLDFYYTSYNSFRNEYESTNTFVLQEAFKELGFWNDQFNNDYLNVSRKYTNVSNFHDIVFDHHHYEVFTKDQLEKSANVRAIDITNYAKSIGKIQKYHPSLVGEFSGAITDCAKWLNGVGTGARYDNTFNESQLIRNSPEDNSTESKYFKSLKKDTSIENRSCKDVLQFKDFSDEHKIAIRQFIEIQLLEYTSETSGWIFWNYKTEDAIEWSFKLLNENGLFPINLTDYQYFYPNGTSIQSSESSAIRSLDIESIKYKAFFTTALLLTFTSLGYI